MKTIEFACWSSVVGTVLIHPCNIEGAKSYELVVIYEPYLQLHERTKDAKLLSVIKKSAEGCVLYLGGFEQLVYSAKRSHFSVSFTFPLPLPLTFFFFFVFMKP